MELKDSFKYLQIVKALRKNSRRMILLSVLSGALVLLNIGKPLVFSRIVDYGLIELDWTYTLWQCIWFGTIAVGIFLCSLGSSVLSSLISNTIVLDMRDTLLNRIFQTDYRLFVDTNTGDIMNRIDGDVSNIRDYILSVLKTATGSFLGFVSAMLYIGVVQWKIILVGFLMTPFVAVCLFLFRQILYRLNRKQREFQSIVNDGILQGIDKQVDIRSLGLQKYFLSKILKDYNALRNISVKSDTFNALNSGIIQFLGALGYILTIGYGGWLVIGKELSVGNLLAFLTLRSRFLAPIEFTSEIYRGFYTTKASFERLWHFFTYPIVKPVGQIRRSVLLKEGSDQLVIENLEFGFKEDRPLFRGVNATFQQGWTGIDGLNGSGKTTFTHLLIGVINPQHGKISFQNKASQVVEADTWAKLFSYSSQKCFLFHGTLRENISILNPGLTDDQIVDELNALNFALDDVRRQIDLDQMIAEDGKNLSGGQRQKIALARTILKDAEVYIFDESISNLDRSSKSTIVRHLKTVLKNKVVIWISHEDLTLPP